MTALPPLPARLQRLEQALVERPRIRLDAADSIRCAVLLPIVLGDEGDGVLYTLRSEALPNHRGQVSFPGGKHSAQDRGLQETALRESFEEVGLANSDVRILGALDDVYTLATRYRITPYVGVLRAGVQLTANPGEVAEIFTVAIDRLGDPAHHGTTTKRIGEQDIELPAIHAGPHEIWGATHRITLDFVRFLEQLG
jgi:8-oxo-dGTP pyrophosphatase MutT (NUDIX family)